MHKKRVAIVSLGYAWLPCEPGPSRFYDIAMKMHQCGYEVDFIGSSFQHFRKEPRNQQLICDMKYPFHITFIDVPKYKKNIDLRRVYSNRIAKKNVLKYLDKHEYDAVYCSIPANDIGAAVSKYCKKKKIPFVVDVEDLWPEAMSMVIKSKRVRDMLLYSFKRDAEVVYRNADAVIGTSDEYTERAFKNTKRDIPHKTVYVGCDLDNFDQGVRKYYDKIEKADNEFWVTYAGSIGTSYDIRTLVLAGKKLLNINYGNIKIKILGTGPLKQELEDLKIQEDCQNVQFLGYVDYQKMAAYLKKSNIVINSFVKGAPQSIVNKIGDYLASGNAVINTLQSKEFCSLVNEYQFGINIEPENVDALALTIIELYKDKKGLKEMGKSARLLAETKFDRKVSYQVIPDMIESLWMKEKNTNEE